MKKTVSMILALTMLLTLGLVLPAAAETAVDQALLGTWVLDELQAEFTFNADGTYDESFFGIEGSGVYSVADGRISIDGSSPMDYVINGDTMTFYDGGDELTFTRKGGTGAANPLLGTWAASNGADISFTDTGDYIVTFGGSDQYGTYTVNGNEISYVIGGNSGTCTFTVEGDTLTITEYGTDTVCTRKGDAPRAASGEETLIGTWQLTGTSLGITIDMQVIFREDGTYTMAAYGEEETGSYTVEADGISFDGNMPEPYTLEGDTLTLDESGILLTFTREGAEVRLTGTADAEALIGSWGMNDIDVSLTFNADGTYISSNYGEESTGTYTVNGDTILIDGVEEMTFSIDGDKLSLSEMGIVITLYRK